MISCNNRTITIQWTENLLGIQSYEFGTGGKGLFIKDNSILANFQLEKGAQLISIAKTDVTKYDRNQIETLCQKCLPNAPLVFHNPSQIACTSPRSGIKSSRTTSSRRKSRIVSYIL